MTNLRAYLTWPMLRDAWREYRQNRVLHYVTIMGASILVAVVPLVERPPLWDFIVRTYITWLALCCGAGLLLNARAWLVWLIGTSLFAAGLIIVR